MNNYITFLPQLAVLYNPVLSYKVKFRPVKILTAVKFLQLADLWVNHFGSKSDIRTEMT